MDQKLEIGGISGCGDSYLEFIFYHFKLFRLSAILRDAAGAVRSDGGKGLGCCYMIGREQNSCVLGHVIGLLFCLYVKLFLPSIFHFVVFRSSLSCIALAIEFANKDGIKKLGFLIQMNVQVYPFRLTQKYKASEQLFECKRNFHGIVCNSGCMEYCELPSVLHRVLKCEFFAKGTEKCKILGL